MTARDENTASDQSRGGFEWKPASTGSHSPHGMDPNYSTHKGDYPWSPHQQQKIVPDDQAGDFAWIQDWHDKQAVQLKEELRRQLRAMPSGQRIRNLRSVLGWTQSMAAVQLGISVRTVIRHEQGRNRSPWLRLPLLMRLRELESEYAEQIIAYLAHGGPEHS